MSMNLAQGCDNLKTVIFNAAPLFNSNVFYSCQSLSEVIFNFDDFISFSSGASWPTRLKSEFGRFYVKDDLVETYKSNSGWAGYYFEPLSHYPITEFGSITDSWEDIIAAENDGTYLTKYALGDTKSVVLNDSIIILQIVAFDTDDLSDGTGKAHITWMSKYA